MKKNIIVYYSRMGSNHYLAEQTAKSLNCPAVRLKPRLSSFPLLLLSSATKISWGNKSSDLDLKAYDSVILCGPIWMGQFISPLYDFLKKYKNDIRELHFMTCCGSTDKTKEDKFGYAHVFRKIREFMGDKSGVLEAFPIEMVLPDSNTKDDKAMMETRLNDSNFTGEIRIRFDNFLQRILG